MKIDLEELEKVVEHFKVNTREVKIDVTTQHGFIEFIGFDDSQKKITIKLFCDNTMAEIIKTEKFR